MSADTLYIGTNGNVAATRIDDGEELWRAKLGGFLSATGYQDVCVREHDGKVLVGCQVIMCSAWRFQR